MFASLPAAVGFSTLCREQMLFACTKRCTAAHWRWYTKASRKSDLIPVGTCETTAPCRSTGTAATSPTRRVSGRTRPLSGTWPSKTGWRRSSVMVRTTRGSSPFTSSHQSALSSSTKQLSEGGSGMNTTTSRRSWTIASAVGCWRRREHDMGGSPRPSATCSCPTAFTGTWGSDERRSWRRQTRSGGSGLADTSTSIRTDTFVAASSANRLGARARANKPTRVIAARAGLEREYPANRPGIH